jgi:hypothetical protein
LIIFLFAYSYCPTAATARSWAMPNLTRRRYPERPDCWHVYYGDVHVGTIARLSGVPVDEDQWGWDCGFYPGTKPHQHRGGTAATFDQARADFEKAWDRLLPTLTEEDFDRWRHARDWTARKYAMWKAGEKMPSQKPNTLMRCPCGETLIVTIHPAAMSTAGISIKSRRQTEFAAERGVA